MCVCVREKERERERERCMCVCVCVCVCVSERERDVRERDVCEREREKTDVREREKERSERVYGVVVCMKGLSEVQESHITQVLVSKEESTSCMAVNSRVSHETPVLAPWFCVIRVLC